MPVDGLKRSKDGLKTLVFKLQDARGNPVRFFVTDIEVYYKLDISYLEIIFIAPSSL